MSNETAENSDASEELSMLFSVAGRKIAQAVSRESLLDWFREAAPLLAPSLFRAERDADNVRRAAGAIGAAFWFAVPQPALGWRHAPKAMPGRNDPCFCGSGLKYKRCCDGLGIPSELFERINLLRFVLDAWPTKDLGKIAFDRLDPEALTDAAHVWGQQGEAQRAATLLEALFASGIKLDARHEFVFDKLMDLWLELGRPGKRLALIEKLLNHPDPDLSSAVHQRKVIILADSGDWDAAWALFHASLRRHPDHPAFAQLELTLLLQQGRDEEARARARFWAQRLRRIDAQYASYADQLIAYAENPAASFERDSEFDSPELQSLRDALANAPPPANHHKLDVGGGDAAGLAGEGFLAAEPALEKLARSWHRGFPIPEPMLTSLRSDVGVLHQELPSALALLARQPLGWHSFVVLDSLSMLAYERGELEPPWMALCVRLGERARALMHLALPEPMRLGDDDAGAQVMRLAAGPESDESRPATGGATLPWSFHQNRVPLRIVVREIAARTRLHTTDPMIDRLQAWMLRLNPGDNHDQRSELSTRLLHGRQFAAALHLCRCYAGSVGALAANEMLASYVLDGPAQAKAIWDERGRHLREIRKALLAERIARPREVDTGYRTVGGRGEAWDYRQQMRDCWIRENAIEWLRGLAPTGRPKPEPGRKKQPEQVRDEKDRREVAATEPDADAIAAARSRYAEQGCDPVFAHGVLVAHALAPHSRTAGLVTLLLSPPTGEKPPWESIASLNQILGGLIAWSNAVLREIGPASESAALGPWSTPWLGEDQPSAPAATRWARGFVASIAQDSSGLPISSKAERDRLLQPFRQLAAAAPASAAERDDPRRLRDRHDTLFGESLLHSVDDPDWPGLLLRSTRALCEAVSAARSAARRRDK